MMSARAVEAAEQINNSAPQPSASRENKLLIEASPFV
jgi:hypothetical protein